MRGGKIVRSSLLNIMKATFNYLNKNIRIRIKVYNKMLFISLQKSGVPIFSKSKCSIKKNSKT